MITNVFNEWLFEVCEKASLHSFNKEKDEQYYFEKIDLTEAKLAFVDNEKPEEFSKNYFSWSNK